MDADSMNARKLFSLGGSGEKSRETSIVFGGDYCPIRRYEQKMLAGEEIFSPDLRAMLRDHVSVVNLEAPLCEATLPTASPSGSGLRGSPKVADYLKRLKVNAWGLANNHIRDYDDEGVRQTIENLQKRGLAWLGAGENSMEAEKPLEFKLNGIRIGLWAVAERELNLASLTRPGAAQFCPERNIARIQNLKKEFDFVVVYAHAGHEFTTVPSPRIRDAYRAFVEAGADVVIGHHPHVVQGIERHGDGLIAYSLGNLVFDSPYVSAYETTDIGFLLRLDIEKHRVKDVQVLPYRMGSDFLVAALTGEEKTAFGERLEALSEILQQEDEYQAEWEKNVQFRWETEYRRILTDFSKNFREQANPDFPRRARNLFTSPTHVEMIEKIFFMMEEEGGRLTF